MGPFCVSQLRCINLIWPFMGHRSATKANKLARLQQIISIVDERPDAQNAEYLLDPPSAVSNLLAVAAFEISSASSRRVCSQGACVDYADLLVNDRMKNDVAKFHGNSTSYSPEPKYECGIQT